MAPKPKITREEILSAAYDLALQNGFSSLSSRTVARAAGCSVQPIFTNFPTMEQLRQEVYHYACRINAEAVLAESQGRDFLTVLVHWMVDLAKNNPNLFELLYLSDLTTAKSVPEALMRADSHQKMTHRISQSYALTLEDGEDVLIRICIFLMGVGTIICINRMDLSEDQVLSLIRRTAHDFIGGRVRPGSDACTVQ